MPDLCYSRNASNDFLTSDQIRARAPAVYAHDYAEDLSTKYGNFNSANAIEVMSDYGYGVTQAAQVKGRSEKSNIYGQHLMAFAKRHEINALSEQQPEIIFYNSHDGKSSMKLFAGIYRFVCSNGIIAGEGFDQRMIHYKSNLDSFENLLTYTAAKLESVTDFTARLQRITPDQEIINQFTKQALSTRYDYLGNTPVGSLITNMFDTRAVRQALAVTRREDMADDAWTIFNRVQESVLRGGFDVLGPRKRYGKKFIGYKKTKAISSVKENVTINRKLWDIAQETLAA
jgi:hypothetical protein